ncbi:MAG: DUF1934 domain-containing protein [Lachnospiraceae bacterium]|jgi:uncharacterized beta-barrel protein YwiB (DUF1934 family)|nr:DUF1934 domain-containing protein [Lachnospiraceae bacterium]
MTKNVLISISGLHYEVGIIKNIGAGAENDIIEVITPARYVFRSKKHYITYEEFVEGFNGSIKNTVIISEDKVEIRKKGITNSSLIFENSKINIAKYHIPYGELNVGIHTKDLRITETPDEIDVLILYELEINGEMISNCHIKMKVTAVS